MGAFIAKESIPWGGVNAYTRGQRVEADIVERHGWHDFVVGENTKEAREIKAEVSGRDISDFETSKSSGGRSKKAEQDEPQTSAEKQEG